MWGSTVDAEGRGTAGHLRVSTLQVNLKEQGQLVRQDEFTVRAGHHKSCRRVFLFEELLLFSKPRRGPAGVDIFTYKRSFKVSLHDSDLCLQPPLYASPHSFLLAM